MMGFFFFTTRLLSSLFSGPNLHLIIIIHIYILFALQPVHFSDQAIAHIRFCLYAFYNCKSNLKMVDLGLYKVDAETVLG